MVFWQHCTLTNYLSSRPRKGTQHGPLATATYFLSRKFIIECSFMFARAVCSIHCIKLILLVIGHKLTFHILSFFLFAAALVFPCQHRTKKIQCLKCIIYMSGVLQACHCLGCHFSIRRKRRQTFGEPSGTPWPFLLEIKRVADPTRISFKGTHSHQGLSTAVTICCKLIQARYPVPQSLGCSIRVVCNSKSLEILKL